jgi:hypothetical protein
VILLIQIKVIPKEYSLAQLKALFIKNTGNTSDEDFNEFISAMQKTGQITETRRNFFRPTVEVEITTPSHSYLTISPEKKKPADTGIVAKKDTISVFHWVGGRINIRAGKEWIDKYGTPEQVTLFKIFKDGKWITLPLKERPTITTTRSPRYPNTVEAYRSEIPAAIVRKYGLTGKEPVRLRIDRIVKNYLSYLQLYGYELDVMSFFGETKNARTSDPRHAKGIRDMELQGTRFPYETKGDITNEIRSRGDKALNVTQAWLEKYDEGYSLLFGLSKRSDVTPPNEGARIIPLIEKPSIDTRFILRDIEKDRTILEATGSLPENWHAIGLDAILTQSKIKTVRDNRTSPRSFAGVSSYQATLTSGFGKKRKKKK